MTLSIKTVSLTDFRSYSQLEFEPDPALTVIVGSNATGKTNVVEAVELLTAADSFRHPQWGECVRWGQPRARLELRAGGDDRTVSIELNITPSGRRAYKVNGSPKKKISEVAGLIPCVVFTPDDLGIVKGSAGQRRASLDGVGDQLSATYLSLRTEYDRIVKQRNALLKQEAPDTRSLESFTEKLIRTGSSFSGHRRRLFSRMAPLIQEAYAGLSRGERLTCTYASPWSAGRMVEADQISLAMTEALDVRARDERSRGVTLVGPHRDDVTFAVNDRDARTFASQGQQRTIALAWKLAEVRVITEIAGQAPVLLLDDVMSELDEQRRHALADLVGGTAQTIITTANLGYFDGGLLGRAKIVTLL